MLPDLGKIICKARSWIEPIECVPRREMMASHPAAPIMREHRGALLERDSVKWRGLVCGDVFHAAQFSRDGPGIQQPLSG